MIRNVKPEDAEAICNIYNHYVLNTSITFETSPVSVEEMTERIKDISAKYPYMVFEEDSEVVGYCYVNTWKNRCAYSATAEASVYLNKNCTGKGIGKSLYKQLLIELNDTSLHAITAGIALPNEPSIKLHESMGFKKVAHFEETGRKFDKWIDVAYWEYIVK
jgi:L-amino acid N-acyltransferase YncA